MTTLSSSQERSVRLALQLAQARLEIDRLTSREGMHMSDLLVKALRVVEAARAEQATGDHVACAAAPCVLCEALAAFDAFTESGGSGHTEWPEASSAPVQAPDSGDEAAEPLASAFLGEFPPLDVCSTGGVHLWADGACARCGVKEAS